MTDTPIQLHISDIAQGGDGVGRHAGKVVFASGGLPGEDVLVHLTEQKKDYARGKVVEVLKPSPDRIAPPFPPADHMSWQHIVADAQLRFKQHIVQTQLARLAPLTDITVAPVIAAPHPWNYRNTAHLHVQGDRIGYYAAGTHEVVDLSYDPLLLPHLNHALTTLRPLLQQGSGSIERVTLRGSATRGTVAAVVYGKGNLLQLLQAWQAQTPELITWVQYRGKKRLGEGAGWLHEELGKVTFLLSPESFFQVATAQAERLLQVVQEGLVLQPDERLLDAYSGVGAFALPLAHLVHEVVAVEEHPLAVADGERSQQHNDIGHVSFVCGKVERVLPTLEGSFEKVILDPPRRGCHAQTLTALLDMVPQRIAYVSCHPGILARDVRLLLEHGYRLVNVQPIDMFPQTPHIECVALLARV
jgi:23S rRNA (uracil1939-C5)-methyltransferase